MTTSEKLILINDLYQSARREQTNPGITINSSYITIDDTNKIEVWKLAANTIFKGNSITLCCIDLTYNNFGWVTKRNVYAICNKDGDLMRNIRLSNWLIEFDFLPTRQSEIPIPEIQLALNSAPNEKIKLKSYTGISYQDIWNFFLDVDETCKSLSEAEIYFKYCEYRFKNKAQEQTLQQYQDELSKKESIINQYQSLLESIKDLISN